MEAAVHNPFATYHPAVPFVCLTCALVLAMALMQPVFVALSCVGAVVCSCVVRGGRATWSTARWALVLAAVVAVANLLFSASGATELFRIGSRAFTAEALVFGCCAGGMLAAVILWCGCFGSCMSTDAVLALAGNAAPTVSLVISQTVRLFSQYLRRGRAIADVQAAVTSAAAPDRTERLHGHLRIVSVLMGWGMEDGIVRSDAMRARGYECGRRRTTYRRYRFGRSDAAPVAATVVLTVLTVWCAVVPCAGFSFYPTVTAPAAWWAYLPYAALMVLSPILAAREAWQWRTR